MVSELIASAGVFKTLFDMAKGLKDINDTTVRNRAVVELLEKIITAREQQATALERIGDLEKEVASFETWEREKQRYELKNFGGNTFAYALKASEADGEPPHCICANCYQQDKKSILQSHGSDAFSREMFDCPSCKTRFSLGTLQPPARSYY